MKDKPRPNWDLAAIMVVGSVAISIQPLLVCISVGAPLLGVLLTALLMACGCFWATKVWKP